jgi:hypothetical protein
VLPDVFVEAGIHDDVLLPLQFFHYTWGPAFFKAGERLLYWMRLMT